jgi:NAD(P)-dependent dehydrogenase (short-subunit alcohol dehydrogenase family)
MGKIVAITGAGRACATEFARQGCDLALRSRDQMRFDTAASELHDFGVRILTISTDVADAAAVDAAAKQIERERGPIDIWVNVAMAPSSRRPTN